MEGCESFGGRKLRKGAVVQFLTRRDATSKMNESEPTHPKLARLSVDQSRPCAGSTPSLSVDWTRLRLCQTTLHHPARSARVYDGFITGFTTDAGDRDALATCVHGATSAPDSIVA